MRKSFGMDALPQGQVGFSSSNLPHIFCNWKPLTGKCYMSANSIPSMAVALPGDDLDQAIIPVFVDPALGNCPMNQGMINGALKKLDGTVPVYLRHCEGAWIASDQPITDSEAEIKELIADTLAQRDEMRRRN
jgi:hypothetical protein